MKTRDRILHTSLRLFNEMGEPSVTTLLIADELDISPGNLYYHFKSKTDILEELFQQFEECMYSILIVPESEMDIEDLWFYLHLIFENIAKFQFLYKDLVTIMAKYPQFEKRFQKILNTKRKASISVLENARKNERLHASTDEIEALTEQIILTTTFWL
ncbi:TetR family transcriptional regulator, partial [Oleiphilus sp. HI0009]